MKKKIVFRLISTAVILTTIAASLFVVPVMAADAYPLTTTDPEVTDALSYLSGEQAADGSIGGFVDSAWVAMAIAAAGDNPNDWQVGGNSVVDYLAAHAGDASSSTDYSRMILAIVASDGDPTSFGSRDFVALLEGTYDSTTQQIGSASALNDDTFGVMALIAAGRTPSSPIVADAVSFLLDSQNGDGGWGWTVGGASDVDMSGAIIMALISAGEPAGSTPVNNALAYIASTQQPNGGFLSWGSTNSETDAWAIGAIQAAGEDPNGAGWTSTGDNTPVDDLLGYQQAGGDFYFLIDDPGAWPVQTTAKAVIGLLGTPYPVVALPPTGEEGVTIGIRIEGQTSNIWSGNVTVTESDITAANSQAAYHSDDPTALGTLDEASQAGSFEYEVSDAYGEAFESLFITSIDGEGDSGSMTSGWLYRVDDTSADIGAGNFILNETTPPDPPHQEILFYYVWDNNWGAQPLKVEVDNAEPAVGEQFTITVSQYSDTTGDWSVCEGATVHAGGNYTTDASGTVAVTVNRDATLEVYAEKEDFIRSNRVTVTVGTGSEATSEVALTASILPAIAINVDPSSLNFGELGSGETSDPQLVTITNEGTRNLEVTCDVSDGGGGLYTNGLELDGELWDLFSEMINRGSHADCSATLTVPDTYLGVGEQVGTIIFWAAAIP